MEKLSLTDSFKKLIQEKYEEYKNKYWINPKTGRKNHIGYILNDPDHPLYQQALNYVRNLANVSKNRIKGKEEQSRVANTTYNKIKKDFLNYKKILNKSGIDKIKEDEGLSQDEFKDNIYDNSEGMFDPEDQGDNDILDFVFNEIQQPVELDSDGKVIEDEETKSKREEIINKCINNKKWNKLFLLMAVSVPLVAWHMINKYKKKFIKKDKEKFFALKDNLKEFIRDEISKTN